MSIATIESREFSTNVCIKMNHPTRPDPGKQAPSPPKRDGIIRVEIIILLNRRLGESEQESSFPHNLYDSTKRIGRVQCSEHIKKAIFKSC